MTPLYESALAETRIRPGTRLLDVGCGPGYFLRLAAEWGATVTGIDGAPPFIELARAALPHADLTVGSMESLPYPEDSFDVVTGFDVFQLAADPWRALREAARVGRAGARVVIASWGRPEQCDAAGYVRAIGGRHAFALAEPGALEEFAARGGLVAGERHDVACTWAFSDPETMLRALTSTRLAVRAAESVGGERLTETVLGAVAPWRTRDGGYRLENVFTYLIATTGRPATRRGG